MYISSLCSNTTKKRILFNDDYVEKVMQKELCSYYLYTIARYRENIVYLTTLLGGEGVYDEVEKVMQEELCSY